MSIVPEIRAYEKEYIDSFVDQPIDLIILLIHLQYLESRVRDDTTTPTEQNESIDEWVDRIDRIMLMQDG